MFNPLTYSEDVPPWHRHVRPIFQGVEPLHLLLTGLVAFNPSVFPYLVTIGSFCLKIITGILHLIWALSPWSFIAMGVCFAGYLTWQAYHNMPERQYKPDPITPYIAARVVEDPTAQEIGYAFLIKREQERQATAEALAPPSESNSSLTGDASSSRAPVPSGHSF